MRSSEARQGWNEEDPTSHGSTTSGLWGARRRTNDDSIAQQDHDCKWSKSEKRIIWWLLARLTRSGDEWRTHLSAQQYVIAAQIGASRRTVLRTLAKLETAGLIQRRHQPLPNGGRRPDLIVAKRPELRAVAGRKCHFRLEPKCHFRSTSLVVKRSCRKTASAECGRTDLSQTSVCAGASSPDTGDVSMQGELFRGAKSGRKAEASVDNAKSRLKTWQDAYRAKYGRPSLIPNIAIVMALIKRWQAQLPTPEHWQELVGAYLKQDDRAVVDAQHPITWLSRRLPALLPIVEKEIAEAARRRAVAEQNAKVAESMTDLQRLRLKHPGIREGETVDAWKVRIKAARERKRAEEVKARRWA